MLTEHSLWPLCAPPLVVLLCLPLTGCRKDKPAATAGAAPAEAVGGGNRAGAATAPCSPNLAGQRAPGEPDVPADMVPHLLPGGKGRDPLDELPPGLLAAATPEQVLPALSSRDETTRRAAVRRLGQIGGAEAVETIAQVFSTARPLQPDVVDQGCSVKEECLRALGSIRGPEAAALLAKLVREQWRKGPRAAEWRDFDYLSVMRSGLGAIARHVDDDACYKLAEEIALSRTVKTSDEGWAREYAYRAYVRGQMLRAGATEQAAQIAYLLEELHARGVGHASDWERPGIKTPQAARDSALMALLVAYGPAVVPYVDAEVEHVASTDTARREALEMVKRLVADNEFHRRQNAAGRERARQARDRHEREMREQDKVEAEAQEAALRALETARAADAAVAGSGVEGK